MHTAIPLDIHTFVTVTCTESDPREGLWTGYYAWRWERWWIGLWSGTWIENSEGNREFSLGELGDEVNRCRTGRIEVIGRNRKCVEKVDRGWGFSGFRFFFLFFPFFSFRVSLCRDTPVVIFRVVSICARRGNTGDIYASGRKFAIQSTATCYRHCGERREKVRVTSICARNCYPLLLFFFGGERSYAFIRRATRGKRRYVPPRLFNTRENNPRVFILPFGVWNNLF